MKDYIKFVAILAVLLGVSEAAKFIKKKLDEAPAKKPEESAPAEDDTDSTPADNTETTSEN